MRIGIVSYVASSFLWMDGLFMEFLFANIISSFVESVFSLNEKTETRLYYDYKTVFFRSWRTSGSHDILKKDQMKVFKEKSICFQSATLCRAICNSTWDWTKNSLFFNSKVNRKKNYTAVTSRLFGVQNHSPHNILCREVSSVWNFTSSKPQRHLLHEPILLLAYRSHPCLARDRSKATSLLIVNSACSFPLYYCSIKNIFSSGNKSSVQEVRNIPYVSLYQNSFYTYDWSYISTDSLLIYRAQSRFSNSFVLPNKTGSCCLYWLPKGLEVIHNRSISSIISNLVLADLSFPRTNGKSQNRSKFASLKVALKALFRAHSKDFTTPILLIFVVKFRYELKVRDTQN